MSTRNEALWALIRARAPGVLVALLPGALTVYLSFHAGGYSAGPTAVVVIVLFLVLAVRVLVAAHPGYGFSALLGIAVVTFGLFALWTLTSGDWSDAPGRALVELDRVLLYLLALVAFASLGGEAWRLRWMLGGMAMAAVIVCGVGVANRLLPELLTVADVPLSGRLEYPLTYANSVGLLAALGMIICFGLAASEREPRLARVLGAAALPVLGSALMLTLSRGAIAAGALGLIVFVVVAHPRALPAGLLAAVPATAIAMTRTYSADFLFYENPLTRAAREQGEHVALVVVLCAVCAALVRALLLPSDRVVADLRPRASSRRLLQATGVVTLLVLVAVSAIALDVPTQYERFLNRSPDPAASASTSDRRSRLTAIESNGRIDFWRVAFDQFREDPLRGRGAGTFELSWQSDRPSRFIVRDGHSLYAEVMAELGLVGLLLLVATLLVILIGIVVRARGPDRALFSTVLAVVVVWVVAAGADWHWEMPAVSLWLFALGGTAIARRQVRDSGGPILALPPRFAVVAALCAVMVAVPLKLHGSDDRLRQAVSELGRGRCDRVTTLAREASAAVDSRTQGYELRARCALQSGEYQLAIRMLDEAIRRDPESWRPRYGLAVARARAGLDPRSAARAALRFNPREAVVRRAVKRFDRRAGARAWRRASRGLEIQVPAV